MRSFAHAALVLLLACAPALAQPTPLPEGAPAGFDETIRSWVVEQSAAVPALQEELKIQEAKLREFRGYLARIRNDAAAQKAQLALGNLRPYDFYRAQQNWLTWKTLIQGRQAELDALIELLTTRRQEEEERWTLLGDQTGVDLEPQVAQSYQQAQALHKQTLGLLERSQTLATSGVHDAQAAATSCDEILQLLDSVFAKMRSRFFFERTTLFALASAPDDLRKEWAALVEPFIESLGAGWVERLIETLKRNTQVLLSGIVLLTLILWRVRYWSRRLESAAVEERAQTPALWRRLAMGLLLALLRTAPLAFFTVAAVLLATSLAGTMPNWVHGLVDLLQALYVWRFAVAFARVVFDPDRPDHRLFDLGADGTLLARRRLERLALWILVGLLVVALVGYVSLRSPPLMLAFLLLQLLALRSVMRSLADKNLDPLGLDDQWRAVAFRLRATLRATIVLLIGLAALGFINLAWFLAWSALKICFLLLVVALVWRVGVELLEKHAGTTDVATRRALRRTWNAAVVLAGVAALPIVEGITSALSHWGAEILAFGVDVGEHPITVGSLLSAFLWLLSAWVVGRIVNAVLTQRVFPRALVDLGVRTAITTTIGYVVIAVGALLGIRALGFDLTSFAIVAGALSVGVGFGMQTVVSNFVSGLIILYERPFRPGDILEYGGVTGSVKKIRTRSTVVQTFDEAELILPNAEILSKPITNWTLSNYRARATIAIGVAYGSDVELVRETLLEVAAAHPRVEDEPKVFFIGFGDSSLDFRLMIWVDVREKMQVVSDVHFSIDKAFRAKHIEIPFPRTDVRIHTSGGGE